MIVRWRNSGEGMGTVDLRTLDDDQIVIHYGGSLNSVDAYTFANSLIAFADTARSVSDAVSPGDGRTEVRVEALGPGSFRAVIKRIPTGLTGFFRRGAENLFWAYVAFLIIDKIHGNTEAQLQVSDDQVIITRGHDRIIVPRQVYEKSSELKKNPDVQKNITKTFEIIEEDEAIENFGLTRRASDVEPLVQVDRREFPRLASQPERAVQARDGLKFQDKTEQARLLVLKLWLKPSTSRKWSFEWNGVPISAPIKDVGFLAKLDRRDLVIGAGDALDVELAWVQVFDEQINMYVNDQSTFEVVRVIDVIQREVPPALF